MKKILGLALLLLAACNDAPAPYQSQTLAYATPPLHLNVAEIKITDAYRSPLQPPNVEQDFPVAPANAVRAWAGQRLVASGPNGVLEVTINDASVRAVALPKKTGLSGLFTDDQGTRYDASIKVNFRLYNGASAMSDASADVTVTRSRSINEKATVNDRQKLYDQMTHELMASFDSQADARFRQYFAGYIKS